MNYQQHEQKSYSNFLAILASKGLMLERIDPKEDGSSAKDDLDGYWNIIRNY